jgi:microcystin-dependent protein
VPPSRQVIAGAGLSGGGALSGDVTLNVAGDATMSVGPDSIGVVSAPRLTSSRTISLTGDVSGSASFDGSANASISAVVAADSHTHTGSTVVGLTPPGVIAPYAGSGAPSGWLMCDGSAVSRSTYSDLYAVCGTTYGVGNGSTTFNLPNLQARVPVGIDVADANFNVRGETGGASTVTLTSSQMPSHTHTYTYKGLFNKMEGTGGLNVASIDLVSSQTSGSAGGGSSHNNLQPYMALHYIIKT